MSAAAIAFVGSTLAVVADDRRPEAPSTPVVSPPSSASLKPAVTAPVPTQSVPLGVLTDSVTDGSSFDG